MLTCLWSHTKWSCQEPNLILPMGDVPACWSEPLLSAERTLHQPLEEPHQRTLTSSVCFLKNWSTLNGVQEEPALYQIPEAFQPLCRKTSSESAEIIHNHSYCVFIFSRSTSVHHRPFITFLKIQCEQYWISSLTHSLLMSHEKLKQTRQKSLET